jgi:hypothetical protein
MTKSDPSGIIHEQSACSQTQKETAPPEDEINLMDYFMVLWKHKTFIFLATLLPASLVAASLLLMPRCYTATYVYDVRDGLRDEEKDSARNDISGWNLNESNYTMLLSKFYSNTNIRKLSGNLSKNGLEKYIGQLSGDQSKAFIKFEVIPPFLDISKLKVTDPVQLNKLRDMRAQLLNVIISGKSLPDMDKLSSLLRDNIKDILPLYIAQEQLSSFMMDYNARLAEIERGRFTLDMDLKSNHALLDGLKNIPARGLDNKSNNIVLQFDIGSQSLYLPLDYQIQAAESRNLELEEKIKITEEKFKYYTDLLDLNTRILAELDTKLSSDYTAEQFKSFLTGLASGSDKPYLQDYLKFYIRKTENQMALSKPVTEEPKISPLAKETFKKSGVVFAIAFMVSIILSFLHEGLKK